MGMGGSLVRALIEGRRAQTNGATIGRRERAAAEAAAAQAQDERDDALEKAMLDRERVRLEGERVGNDRARVDIETGRAARDGEKFEYEKTQRPQAQRLTESIIERNRRTGRGGGGAGGASGAGKPMTEAQRRSGRAEFVRDVVRAEALQRNLDLSKATPEQRKTLAALAMQRAQASPDMRAKAAQFGVSYVDYMSEAGGGRGAGSDGMAALAAVLNNLPQQ